MTEVIAFIKPAPEVQGMFAACVVLLANTGGRKDIPTTKEGAPKDTSWNACKPLLGGAFIKQMCGLFDNIEQVPQANWMHVRPFIRALELRLANTRGFLYKYKTSALHNINLELM